MSSRSRCRRPALTTIDCMLAMLAALMLSSAGCDDGGGGSASDTSMPSDAVGDTMPTPDSMATDTSTTDDTATPEDTNTGPECTEHAECTDDAAPVCDAATGTCVALPEGHPIGWGDGSADSVTLTSVYDAPGDFMATDLEFNPARPDELWIVLRHPESNASCTESNPTLEGCTALEGSVAIVTNPGTPESTNEIKTDENAWHFMRRPPSIAFGVDGFFATCGEARTGNYLDSIADFIGPTLWSSDPDIFAVTPPGGNGSHMDMLHETPWCMGIAHEKDNIYWLFNGNVGALDRYDFHADHGPGEDDHSDGEIWRYAEGEVSRVPGVPSHMVFYADSNQLYVADTGNGRIVALNTRSGTEGGDVIPNYDMLETAVMMDGATLTDVVAPGTLDAPSGLALHDGLLYVTDNATSMVHAFDLAGNPVRSLETGLPEGSLAGLTFSPDGEVYLVDMPAGEVLRIDPK